MQASPSGESIPSESNEEVTASGEYLGEPVDMKKFSFAFDPINDSHLLARNASVLCNNDKVGTLFLISELFLFFDVCR